MDFINDQLFHTLKTITGKCFVSRVYATEFTLSPNTMLVCGQLNKFMIWAILLPCRLDDMHKISCHSVTGSSFCLLVKLI